jgi:hypothetical protein
MKPAWLKLAWCISYTAFLSGALPNLTVPALNCSIHRYVI